MKLQAQAVLRRDDLLAPLRLAGVLLAGSFYPLSPQDAWGPLHLEVGLVALAPLTPVIATESSRGAEMAMYEARSQWSDARSAKAGALAWLPIGQVRGHAVDEDIRALIAQMNTANEIRTDSTPSTPPYHRAARELERLAGLVYESASAEERVAEEGAERRKGVSVAARYTERPNGAGGAIGGHGASGATDGTRQDRPRRVGQCGPSRPGSR